VASEKFRSNALITLPRMTGASHWRCDAADEARGFAATQQMKREVLQIPRSD
jgi:hypothetical protein